MLDVVSCNFQQYFSYIVVVSFIDGGTGVLCENHRSATSHSQTLSHKVLLNAHLNTPEDKKTRLKTFQVLE
jgi:hypothetical protein